MYEILWQTEHRTKSLCSPHSSERSRDSKAVDRNSASSLSHRSVQNSCTSCGDKLPCKAGGEWPYKAGGPELVHVLLRGDAMKGRWETLRAAI